MQVNKYQDDKLNQNRVDIYYIEEDAEVKRLLSFLYNDTKILGRNEMGQKALESLHIYYFEAVDKKCFAYCEQEVYQVDFNLLELENQFVEHGFIRVNKSTILNINQIDYIKMEINMKVNAYLKNGECIVINRTYKKAFTKRLEKLTSKVRRT